MSLTSSSSSSSSSNDEEVSYELQNGLTGLQNIGNTCYMNAALQALSNCPPLTRYFQACSQSIACRADSRHSVARYYAELVDNLWWRGSPVKRRAVVDPSALSSQFRAAYPAFRINTQQDAQEFLRCFLDRLHEELAEPAVCFLDSQVLTPQNAMQESQISTGSESSSFPRSKSCVQFTTSDVSTEDFETAEDDNCDDDADYVLVKDEAPPDLIPRPEPPKQSPPPRFFRRLLSSSETLTVTANISAPIQRRRSIISDLFDGQIRSCVKCLTCGNVSTTKERFQDLSLPIPNYNDLVALRRADTGEGVRRLVNNANQTQSPNSSWFSWVRSWLSWSGLSSSQSSATPTLSDCLSAFFVADELKGDDMYSCSHCAKLRNGIRYAELLEPLPELLCIHLKRFRHDLNNGVSKIKQPVSFPLKGLDLRPFMASRRHSAGSISEPDASETSSTFYDLVAIVQHDGVPAAGHYTAICRHEPTGLWYEYDDDCCTHVSLEKVSRAQAYVLFYRRRPAPSCGGALLRQLASLVPGLARSLLLSAEWREKHAQASSSDGCCYDDENAGDDYYEDNNRRRHFSHEEGNYSVAASNKASSRRHSTSKRSWRNKSLAKRHHDKKTATLEPPLSSSSSLLGFYVSKRWLVRLESFAVPGPVTNYDFLCEHGAVQPRLFPYVAGLVERVPEPAWQQLRDTFGGGPACNKLYECHWCRGEAENTRARQARELETYHRLESVTPTEARQQFAISMGWFRRWRGFVSASSSSSPAYVHTNGSGLLIPPGPIDNTPIVANSPSSSSSSLSSHKLRNGCVDFARINEATWHFLHGIYGGGPELALSAAPSHLS